VTEPADRSARLGEVSAGQVDAALSRFGLGRATAEPAPVATGNWGQNLRVVATSGTWLLRGSPSPVCQFRAEQWFAERLHDGGVPTPWPYLVDDDPSLFGWPYAFMPWLPGIAIHAPGAPALTAGDERAIASAMGTTLARIQAVPAGPAGFWDCDAAGIVPLAGPYATQVAAEVLRLSSSLYDRSHGGFSSTDRDLAAGIAQQARRATSDAGPDAVVVHADYTERNVLVDHATDGWAVTAVFDLAASNVGDAEADMPRILATYRERGRPDLEASFLASYGRRRALAPGTDDRFRLHATYDRLLMWEFAYNEDLVWWDRSLPFREWARPFLEPPRALPVT
jgi:hygromycin-B 7''-O-kinase